MRRISLRMVPVLTSLAFALPMRGDGAAPTAGLAEEWRWTSFPHESGFPSERALDIVPTPDGPVWLRTRHAVGWYDEFRWRPATLPEAVPPRTITASHGGADGTFLIVAGGRAYQVDRTACRPLLLTTGDGPLDVRDVVPAADGGFVAITAGGEAWHFLGATSTPLTLPNDTVSPEPARRWRLTRTRSGRVWLATARALHVLEGESWRPVIRDDVTVVRESQAGHGLAVGATSAIAARDLWAWRDGARPRRLELTGGHVGTADVDRRGNAVVAYTDGRVWHSGEDGRWVELEDVPTELQGPPLLRFDARGDLWIADVRGTHLCRLSSRRWERLPTPEGVDRHVSQILVTRRGEIWTGTRRAIVVYRNGREPEVISSLDGTEVRDITALAEDRNGDIWVGSGAHDSAFSGAFRHDGSSWSHVGASDGLGAECLHTIEPDRDGNLWFLGLGRELDTGPGAFRFDGERFERWGPEEGLIHGRVYDFAQDGAGGLWFATLRGLSRHRDGRWRHWGTAELRTTRIFTIAAGAGGRLWFGHQYFGGGLGYIDERDEVHYLTTADGLASDDVLALTVDDDGTLWIATSVGLEAIRPDGVYSSYSAASGLRTPHIWPMRADSEKLYLGTQGAGTYILTRSELEGPPPAIVIAPPAVDGSDVSLRWRPHPFRGELTEQILMRYRMDGGPWSAWGTGRELRVLGLDSGRHELKVQATGPNSIGKRSTAATVVAIQPGFYQRPAVYAALAVWGASLAAIAGLYLSRRRSYHAAIRDRERYFRSLVENASDSITVVDRGGVVRYQSPASLAILGIAPQDLVDRPPTDHIVEADRERATTLLTRPAGATPATQRATVRFRHRDGGERALELVAQALDDSEAMSTVVNARDVTERMQMEAERTTLEQERRRAHKMEALGTLAGGIAHDFNNVLLTINGYTELVRADLAEGSDPHDQLTQVLRATRRAQGMIEQILTFSRGSAPELTACDGRRVVAEALDFLRVALPSSIAIERRLPEGATWLRADPSQLHQILLNLGSNAHDAMPDGGVLSLVLEAVEIDSALAAELKTIAAGRAIHLIVSDTGQGIDAELLGRIFDPFFTTKRPGRGTGLGLSVAHGIILSHGGAVRVSSSPGRGTRFEMFFPQCDPAELGPPSPPSPDAVIGARVLLVDDEPAILDTVKELLRHLGHSVVTKTDGAEALGELMANPDAYDLLLTDQTMPRLTGLQLIREARKVRPDIAVILSTGFSNSVTEASLEEANISGLLLKPYRLDQLSDAVGAALTKTHPSGGPRES